MDPLGNDSATRLQQDRDATAPGAHQECNESAPSGTPSPQLTPTLPPGRSTRKARAFHAEIAQLREQGYTLEAIRRALLEVGVSVSRSTVLRESVRPAGHPRAAVSKVSTEVGRPASPLAPTPVGPDLATAPGTRPPPARCQTSKDIAAAFVRGRITNPLILAKEGLP